MQKWEAPRDLWEFRGFLGLTGYYQRFVKGYERIAKPLTNMLKKNNFRWSEDAQEAFERLKTAMTSISILAMLDFSKKFILETNTSGQGLDIVLKQGGKPIAFLSKALSLRNKRKSVYERKFMTIVLAFQKWQHHLLGRHCKVHANQKFMFFDGAANNWG